MAYILTTEDRAAMRAIMLAHCERFNHRITGEIFSAAHHIISHEALYYTVHSNNYVYRVTWDTPDGRRDDAKLITGALRDQYVPRAVAQALGWTGDDG